MGRFSIQAQILDLLRDLRRREGMALLLITHDLGVVAGLADRMVVMYAGRVVEEGPVGAVYARPRHPYTWSLLHAVPRLDVPGRRRLCAIPGQPPDLLAVPPGCAFHPRCRHALRICQVERPPFFPGDVPGQRAACWLADARAPHSPFGSREVGA